MNAMPLSVLGPRDNGSQITFGIWLPGITPAVGQLKIKIIHERDQMIQTEQPFTVAMKHGTLAPYGDYWSVTVDLATPGSGRNWGQTGTYVYRYCLSRTNQPDLDWIIDPFAREFGAGRHAAFTYGFSPHTWSPNEASWKTPRQEDLVLYELNLHEFAGKISDAVQRLDYLADLGINCVSLMPITNICDSRDWGYTPCGYMGVDERFGDRHDFQNFVDEAHQRGIAVLVDAIYGHTSSLFGYEYLYSNTGVANPMMGAFAADMFGTSVDWNKPFAQDFFFSVNEIWLEKFHVDGFRYDCVPNYWSLNPPDYPGYASLVYATHQHVKANLAASDYSRFAAGPGPIRLIQCAEQLEAVADVLDKTYSTCAWQEKTLSAAKRVAAAGAGALPELGKSFAAMGLPSQLTVNGDTLPKAPLQYIENHDKSRFICEFGTYNPDEDQNPLFAMGDRWRSWYRVQPYLVGILMAKGVPLLWQGQELAENDTVASKGASRTQFLRPVNWEYFYDAPGRATLSLVRDLLALRKRAPHIRDGECYFFNDDQRYHNKGLLLFARYYPNTTNYTLVALNFTDHDVWAPFWFPLGGMYTEELHGRPTSRGYNADLNLQNVTAYQEYWLKIPGNYGRVWSK